ncbi:MAG: hypothetical protein KKH94_00685 [Candidatus Omnitrophica bacterium]|nr:hypothetical protein [Candidatus Omnitrophota bacterium]
MECPRCRKEIEYLLYNTIKKIWGLHHINDDHSHETNERAITTYYTCPRCNTIVEEVA